MFNLNKMTMFVKTQNTKYNCNLYDNFNPGRNSIY